MGLGRAQEDRRTPNAQVPTPKRNERARPWELGVGSWELLTLPRKLLFRVLKLALDRRLFDALAIAGQCFGPGGNRILRRHPNEAGLFRFGWSRMEVMTLVIS